MKLILPLLILTGWLSLYGSVSAQTYDTPPFNFDRRMDNAYVDSLLRSTRTRLLALDRLRPGPAVDTARMEFMHFIAYVHYSGMAHRDSALLLSNQLVRLAERKRNVKYQIKGLLQIERYYRAIRTDYPKAIEVNYRILSLIDLNPRLYDLYLWRVYRNLGNISTNIGSYEEAVTYLQKSIVWFDKDKKIERTHLADLHQYLADCYKQQQRLDEAETHYLLSWKLLNENGAQLSNKAYLTNDIGRLYNSQQKPAQAVPYLKQAIAYWEQLKAPLPQADALADLAESYLAMGQYANAIATAEEALAKNQKVHVPVLTSYAVLISAYEKLHDWQNAFLYQQRYNDRKEEQQQAMRQSEAMRLKAKYDNERLETAYRQERLLQNQRYQTLLKQAEIDRLNSVFKTNELRRQAQTNDLRHQLESQQLRSAANQNQATINQLKIAQLRSGLTAQKKLQNQLFGGLAVISLLGLLLLYYSLRLRRANGALRAKNREIELALIKGQTMERKRVATELHDRVSSLLGATKMTFQTIDAETLPPREKKLYENSLNLLNDAATQVRQLSHNLIPEQLLQQDLTVSLRNLVRKLNLVGKTVFSLSCDPNGRLPLSQEATFNLYIICLELCTNVLHHARARQAHLRLVWHDNWLAVQLNDDGIGLDASAQAGMGLHNIQERARSIGAQFRLESGGHQGTQASILLPLNAA